MTDIDIDARVAVILAEYNHDPELAHVAEDDLMAELIKAHCPEPIRQAMARLWADGGPRWSA